MTTLPWFRNVRVKTFGSNEEVRDAVLASACIVPPPLHLPAHGYAMDGAFSDFQILKVGVPPVSNAERSFSTTIDQQLLDALSQLFTWDTLGQEGRSGMQCMTAQASCVHSSGLMHVCQLCV